MKKQQFLPLYLIVFLCYFAYSITIPIFTAILIHPIHPAVANYPQGLRTIILGALLAIYPTGQFFGGSILGAFSDHFGRKKVLITSLLVAILCFLGLSFALIRFSLPFIFILLFIAGFFESNVTIAQNVIADRAPKESRTRKIGFVYAFISLGFLCGTMSAGFLANPNIVSWFGYWTPFILVSFFLALGLIWIISVFEESFKPVSFQKLHYFESLTNLKNIFRNGKLRFFFLINALLYFSLFGFFRTIPMHIVGFFKINITFLSILLSYMSLTALLTNFILMKPITRHFSNHFIVTSSSIFYGCSLIAIPLFHFIDSLWVTLCLSTLFSAICISSCSALLSHAAHPHEQGKVMGNNMSISGGMQALSALTGGLLASISLSLPLIVFGAIAIFAGLLLFLNKNRVLATLEQK